MPCTPPLPFRTTSSEATSLLHADLASWLDQHALGLDDGRDDPALLLPRLAAAGVFAAGLPKPPEGPGGDITEAVEAIAQVSARSLAAGFVLWSQRSVIELLRQSPNKTLRAALLPAFLDGTAAGAPGLSNAMKALAGLEELQIIAASAPGGLAVTGRVPWATNLRAGGFHVAVAIKRADGQGTLVAALPHDAPGLHRSEDLGLVGLRSTNTAAVELRETPLLPEQVIHPDAASWLPQVRPAFLGLQCGMSIGLARRALEEATRQNGAGRGILRQPLIELTERLAMEEQTLHTGLRNNAFQAQPAALFGIRIRLAAIVMEAVGLELQALGGRAYLQEAAGFQRRWREAAFIPVITPSLVQLQATLAIQPGSNAVA